MKPDLKIETAIIGAGTSVLYSAYRLVTDKKYTADQVQIFDMSNKLGGRLESVIMPGMDFAGKLIMISKAGLKARFVKQRKCCRIILDSIVRSGFLKVII
ncbi:MULTISPECIES: NAD(P)-binding protein [unclassified Flavobacterium]|uniref:NAD(P)-binding protein n=1 Tax=unclassified Flavobacterium TaxID=196869 RepID=UPI001E30FAFC|nr:MULTISPECIES: NAD(P)-binding protein [unclassified Flavobacterium]